MKSFKKCVCFWGWVGGDQTVLSSFPLYFHISSSFDSNCFHPRVCVCVFLYVRGYVCVCVQAWWSRCSWVYCSMDPTETGPANFSFNLTTGCLFSATHLRFTSAARETEMYLHSSGAQHKRNLDVLWKTYRKTVSTNKFWESNWTLFSIAKSNWHCLEP